MASINPSGYELFKKTVSFNHLGEYGWIGKNLNILLIRFTFEFRYRFSW